MKMLEFCVGIFLIVFSILFIEIIIKVAIMVFSEIKDMLDDWRKV